jgi:hypothetical protein
MEQRRSDEGYRNLDALCAHFGSQIVEKRGPEKEAKRLETVTRNALGVMREQGVFAFYIFLQNQLNDGGRTIWGQVKKLWQNEAVGPLLGTGGGDRDKVIALTDNLNDLLLARKLAEQALVYALYGLRAERKKKE